MSNLSEHIQKSSVGGRVELFKIDLSRFNETSLFLTPAADEGVTKAVTFDTQDYSPHPIKMEGVSAVLDGPLPRPTFMLGNIGRPFKALLASHDDFRGATVTRIRTFEKFLDGSDDADPLAVLPLDTFRVLRKTKDTKTELHFELAAFIDQSKADLPGEVIMRDFCPLIYRRYVDSAFVYDQTDMACPYTGTDYFDGDDASTTVGNDACSKLVTGCKARFGANNPLPFGGFPGAARLRNRS